MHPSLIQIHKKSSRMVQFLNKYFVQDSTSSSGSSCLSTGGRLCSTFWQQSWVKILRIRSKLPLENSILSNYETYVTQKWRQNKMKNESITSEISVFLQSRARNAGNERELLFWNINKNNNKSQFHLVWNL